MTEDNINETKIRKESQALDDLIYQGEVIVENYNSDPVLTQGFLEIGYTDEKMAEAKEMILELKSLVNNCEVQRGIQKGSTTDVNSTYNELYEMYMNDLKYCKIAFKNDYKIETFLNLVGKREVGFAKSIAQIERFYTNIQRDDVLPKLAVYSINQELIDTRLAKISEVMNVDAIQEQKKGEMKLAVDSKQNLERKYIKWLREIKALMKLKFGRDSAIIEKLKI